MSELKITAVECLPDPAGPRPDAADRRQGDHQPAGAVRPGLRHLHAAHPRRCRRPSSDTSGPFAVGRDPRNIEDFWQSAMVNGYWRNGPVLNNAISGRGHGPVGHQGQAGRHAVLRALGRQVPPGGRGLRPRRRARAEEVADNVRRFMEQGFRHVRCQLGGYVGLDGPSRPQARGRAGWRLLRPHARSSAACRPSSSTSARELGDEVELLHDVHERLAPIDAVWLAKAPGAVPALLPGGRCWPRRTSSGWPTSAASVRHAHRHGRAVQPPARDHAR